MGDSVRAPLQAGTPTACPHEAPTDTAGTQHIPRSAQASAPLEVGRGGALKPVSCHGHKPGWTPAKPPEPLPRAEG